MTDKRLSEEQEKDLRMKLKELILTVKAPHDTDWPVFNRLEDRFLEQLRVFYTGSWRRYDLWHEHLRMDDDGGPPHG